MKLALTGPHCSGKTTVMRALEEELGHSTTFQFLAYDGSRSPISYANIDYLRAHPHEEITLSYWMLTDLIGREIEAEAKYKNIILDRCVIDQIVYPLTILGESKVPESLFNISKDWMSHSPYSHVFIFPKNNDLLRRYGSKDKDPLFLQEIEQNYFKLIKYLNVNHTILPTKQKEQIEIIKRHIHE